MKSASETAGDIARGWLIRKDKTRGLMSEPFGLVGNLSETTFWNPYEITGDLFKR